MFFKKRSLTWKISGPKRGSPEGAASVKAIKKPAPVLSIVDPKDPPSGDHDG